MREPDSAGAHQWYAEQQNVNAGDGESVSGGDVGTAFEGILSGEPSNDIPVTAGTYAIYHATDGSIVLVLCDSRAGTKTIPIPKAMVRALSGMKSGKMPLRGLPLSIFGMRGNRG
jgi:hypothetical protein